MFYSTHVSLLWAKQVVGEYRVTEVKRRAGPSRGGRGHDRFTISFQSEFGYGHSPSGSRVRRHSDLKTNTADHLPTRDWDCNWSNPCIEIVRVHYLEHRIGNEALDLEPFSNLREDGMGGTINVNFVRISPDNRMGDV